MPARRDGGEHGDGERGTGGDDGNRSVAGSRRAHPRANPSCSTTHVSRITPPTRTTPASGPATWAMPRLASGTPPNGNEKRTASTSVWAAGRPTTRQRPVGATSSARPWNAANTIAAAM